VACDSPHLTPGTDISLASSTFLKFDTLTTTVPADTHPTGKLLGDWGGSGDLDCEFMTTDFDSKTHAHEKECDLVKNWPPKHAAEAGSLLKRQECDFWYLYVGLGTPVTTT
jgi:hypothetical protein